MEAILDGKSVLIFCSTKFEVEAAAKQFGGYLHHCMSRSTENRFPQLATIINMESQRGAVEYFVAKTSSKDETLQRCITYGVGWHHAGMAVLESGLAVN
jgi:replicative superfamily II helicase